MPWKLVDPETWLHLLADRRLAVPQDVTLGLRPARNEAASFKTVRSLSWLTISYKQSIYPQLQIPSHIKGRRKSSEEMTACSNRSGLFPSDSCIAPGHQVVNLSLTTQIQIQTWKEQALHTN